MLPSDNIKAIESCKDLEKLKNAIEALISAQECSEVLRYIR